MARDQHVPLWRTAIDLALQIERAVAHFPRTQRDALGSELRRSAQNPIP